MMCAWYDFIEIKHLLEYVLDLILLASCLDFLDIFREVMIVGNGVVSVMRFLLSLRSTFNPSMPWLMRQSRLSIVSSTAM